MVESSELLSKLVDWASIPLTAVLGLVGYHYKKTVDTVEILGEQVDKLEIHGALNHQDIKYIKKACDQITHKLEKIEAEIRSSKG